MFTITAAQAESPRNMGEIAVEGMQFGPRRCDPPDIIFYYDSTHASRLHDNVQVCKFTYPTVTFWISNHRAMGGHGLGWHWDLDGAGTGKSVDT